MVSTRGARRAADGDDAEDGELSGWWREGGADVGVAAGRNEPRARREGRSQANLLDLPANDFDGGPAEEVELVQAAMAKAR
jgi:hypothetical protein